MFSHDIGIDLGTANVLIYLKGEGVVLNEPSVVAIDSNTKKPLAVGTDARGMLGRTPGKVVAIKPLKDGVIADFDTTGIMLDHFIKKAGGKSFFRKPRILICCPSNITGVEKQAIKDAAIQTGARKVFIEEEPKVAAIGAGIDISEANGNMIIDIGGGTTDIAVLSLGGIVTSESIKVAGNTFDADIMKYVKDKYKLLIGDATAENIKLSIGTVYPMKKDEDTMLVKGRDLNTGLPNSIVLSSNEIAEALKDSSDIIIHTAKSVLEKTPPELAADIATNGVTLTGGGALIKGFDKLIHKELKIPVRVADAPLECVALGTGIMLDNINLIDNV